MEELEKDRRIMKKVAITLMALTLSVSALAEKIGFVNSQEAFAKYSQTKVIQENLNKEKNRLENEIKQKEVALQKAQLELQSKGDKITDKEKQEFQKQVEAFQKFVRDSQTKLSKEEYTRMQEIEKTMSTAIQSVAKAGKYDYVLEAGAVKFGGTDITADVLKAMEKAKK
jgi:outer membrane protein